MTQRNGHKFSFQNALAWHIVSASTANADYRKGAVALPSAEYPRARQQLTIYFRIHCRKEVCIGSLLELAADRLVEACSHYSGSYVSWYETIQRRQAPRTCEAILQKRAAAGGFRSNEICFSQAKVERAFQLTYLQVIHHRKLAKNLPLKTLTSAEMLLASYSADSAGQGSSARDCELSNLERLEVYKSSREAGTRRNKDAAIVMPTHESIFMHLTERIASAKFSNRARAQTLLSRLSGGRWYRDYDTLELELRPTALATAKLEHRARSMDE